MCSLHKHWEETKILSRRGPLCNACLMMEGRMNHSIIDSDDVTRNQRERNRRSMTYRDAMRKDHSTEWGALCICVYVYVCSMLTYNNMQSSWAHAAQLFHRGAPFAVKRPQH